MNLLAGFNKNLISLFTILFFLVVFHLFSSQVQAATATWTNTGGDGLWSTCANWSGGTGTGGCPGTSDIATFNSNKPNATIDAAINVGGINIGVGYTGTVTQSVGIGVTVGSSNYTQAGGTYTGSNSAITINGSYSLTGGIFTSTSDTISGLTLKGNLTITGIDTVTTFNNNGGKITISGTFGQNPCLW